MSSVTAPLAHVSVLDLSIWRPGPYATSLLGGLGADVLKVEPPGGDPMRHYPELFASVNAGKRSIVLNLKEPGDRARALALAAEADVLVEGFRPGVMTRLGLDEPAARAVNPGVVYCSISGYGQQGPLSRQSGHDINYQAWAGALAPEGGVATMPPLPLADLASGMAAAFGICAALLGRVAAGPGPGPGSYIDVSMTDVMATWTGSARAVSDEEGDVSAVRDGGSWAPSPTHVPGYGLFATADGGQVALGVVNEQHFWSALCTELGLTAEADVTFGDRMRTGAELGRAVAGAIGRRPRDEVVASLLAVGVPVAPVLDRAGMIARAPFPMFPLRLGASGDGAAPSVPASAPDSEAAVSAPTLDQHRGQGFGKAASV
jgi:crotonobetainyl-CoA:carnitine CoA-transferase CaiB-like acyl-CoA transferase